MGYSKPLPGPDSDTQPFWDGCREHKLLIVRCPNCSRLRFPPTHFCPYCRAEGQDWVEASGKAKVFSWIVVRHPVPKEVYAEDVPYVVALMTLEEGVRMVSNIEGVEPGAVTADMALRVTFRDVTPETSLPIFVPDQA